MKEDNNFELRKENFMLKQKNQILEQEISAKEEVIDKAINIIRTLIDENGKFYSDYPDFVIKAEQFLKEAR